MVAHRRRLLAVTAFWALLVIAVVGTLNPSSGDVSVFLPTEQAFLAGHVRATSTGRTSTPIYNLGGAFAGAFGALASGLPERIARPGRTSRPPTPPRRASASTSPSR